MIAVVVVAILLVLLVASFFIQCFAVALGLRWVKATNKSWRRIVAFVLISWTLSTTLSVVVEWMSPSLGQVVAGILLTILAWIALIKFLFSLAWMPSIQAWLPTPIAGILMTLIVGFLVRPYLVDSFVCPTNSMSPTLVGHHWSGTCPVCGNRTFRQPLSNGGAVGADWMAEQPMICEGNFHVTTTSEMPEDVVGGDRFFVAQFVAPRRWDLITFLKPDRPNETYVKRLVGMPGEEITIRDGTIYADGKKLTPPTELKSLRYKAKHDDMPIKAWGSIEKPAKLSEDEYFVLGDFQERSLDARFWLKGAPGHAPYAVPKSHITGVVSQTYWPPDRWRAFR